MNTNDKKIDKSFDLNKSVFALALMPNGKPLKLTEVERKLFNVLLKISMDTTSPERTPDGLEWYSATLGQIGDLLLLNRSEMGSTFYRTALRNLMEVTLAFSSLSDSDMPADEKEAAKVLKIRHLLDKVDVDEKVGGVYLIRWTFDTDMKPYLLNPKRFAQLKLESISKLSRSASIVLYEICARFKGTQSGSTGPKNWKWWVTALTGLPTTGPKRSKTFEDYRYFKNRILVPCIEEINEKTELNIEMEVTSYIARSVSEIRFIVKNKDSIESRSSGFVKPPVDPYVQSLIEKCSHVGITEIQVNALVKKFTAAAVSQGVDKLQIALKARENDSSLDPIKSNHAYVKSILVKTNSSPVDTNLFVEPSKATTEKIQPQTKQKSLLKTEDAIEILAPLEMDGKKTEIKKFLISLSPDAQREYAQRGFNRLPRAFSTPRYERKIDDGSWIDAEPFLNVVIDLIAEEQAGQTN